MALQKAKIAAALLLTVGLLGGGGALAVRSVLAAPPPAPAAAPADPAPPRAAPAAPAARLGSTRLRHGDVIDFLRFLPDGRLATAGKDGTLRLWDVAAGTELRRFERPEPPPGPAAAPADDRPLPPRAMRLPPPDPLRNFRVAVSADGKLLAATRGQAAHVWDVATGRLLHTLQDDRPAGPGGLADLTFADGGRSLVTVTGDRVVAFWDLQAEKVARRLDGEAMGPGIKFRGAVALAPGGRYLAWEEYDTKGQNAALKVHDLTTGRPAAQAELPVDGARALTFAPDGKTLAWTSFDGGLRVWDCTAGKGPRLIEGEPGLKHAAGEVESLVFAPDGKTLAACRSDGTARLWDVAAGKPVCQLGTPPPQPTSLTRVVLRMAGGALHASPVQLAFAPDGKTVAASLGGALIRRFDAHTGQEIAPPAGGHAGPVTGLHVSADGRTLTTYAGNDVAHVWDLATGREARQVPVPRDAGQAALAAGGRYLATATGSTVTVWDLDTAKEAGKIELGRHGATALALAPDGATVATRPDRSHDVILWDRAAGKARHTLTASADEDAGAGAAQVLVSNDLNGVLCPDLVFSPDGRYLAGAGPRRQLCLWDVASGATVWEQALPGDQVVERFAFTGGGLALAAVNRDGTLSLYETATGEPRGRLGRPGRQAAGRPMLMLGGAAMMVSNLPGAGPTPIALASSPDGRFLATASGEPVIHLWDVVTGAEVGTFKGHDGNVVSLAFSADGQRLFSGSTDTTVLVWNVGQRPRAAADAGPQDADADWAALAGDDAAAAFAAVRRLSRHPAQAAEVIRQRLRPASAADPARTARLIADLDSTEFAARQKATAELAALGEQARPALEKALAGDVSLEVRQRLERLLQKLTGKAGGEQLRELRAVEVLELAGGPEARHALEALARGAPEARLTRAARAALERQAR